ncbi:MAG: hypothetical protein IT270_12990 [Saprospiraceae bacterium]|nr:hypothetical protein [Saprospiraceae bacterium]
MNKDQIASIESKKQRNALYARGAFSIISIGGWLLLFMLGMLIDSEPYRTHYQSDPTAYCTGFMIIWTWTPINIGLLSLFAGLIGGLNRGLLDRDPTNDHQENGIPYRCWTGLVAGFVIYLGFMAGLIIISDDLFGKLTVEKYNKLASLLSITAIVAGLRPEFLEGLFSKVHDTNKYKEKNVQVETPEKTITTQSIEIAPSDPVKAG